MNWEAFGAIGEVVGAIVVIASVLYVAKQLQLNSKQLEASNSHSQALWSYEIYHSLAMDKELAEIWSKGTDEFADLSAIEQQRLLHFEISALVMWSHLHYLESQNLSPDHFKKLQLWAFEEVGKRQSMQEAWKAMKPGFTESFKNALGPYIERHAS